MRVAAGLRFRWMEGDIRSVLWNARRGTAPSATLSAFVPRRGTVHSFSTVTDPGPTVARARYLLRRLSDGASRKTSAVARDTTSSSGSDTSR